MNKVKETKRKETLASTGGWCPLQVFTAHRSDDSLLRSFPCVLPDSILMGYITTIYYIDDPEEPFPLGPYHEDLHFLSPDSLALFRRVELVSSPLHIAFGWYNNNGFRYSLSQRPPLSWAADSLELQEQYAAYYPPIERTVALWRARLARFIYPALGIQRTASPAEFAIRVRQLQSWTLKEGSSDWQRVHEALMLVELEELSTTTESALYALITREEVLIEPFSDAWRPLLEHLETVRLAVPTTNWKHAGK